MKLSRHILGLGVAVLAMAIGVLTVGGIRSASALVWPDGHAIVTQPQEIETTSAPVAIKEPVFVGPAASEEAANTTDSETFDPGGSYYTNSAALPKSFSDIEHLEVQTRQYYDERGNYVDKPIAPKGLLQTKKVLKLTRIFIGGRELAFQTETVDGVSYKFTGRFVTEAYCETEGDKPDLKGRLIKIIDGKWAAEMGAEFYLSCGC